MDQVVKNNKVKVLLLITNLGMGGAQRVFHDLSVALGNYADVNEAVFDINELPNYFKSGHPLYSLGVRGKKNLLFKVINFFKRPVRLKRIVDNLKTDICISHLDGANWINVLSGTRAKKILVVHGTVLHDYEQSRFRLWLRKNILIPYLYNRAEVTIAVSEGIRYELQNSCKVKNAIVIPNFFDNQLIKQKASEPLPQEEEKLFSLHKVLINSGRFHESKNQAALIDVFKHIKGSEVDAKLVLIGDGELRDDLVSKAKATGLRCYFIWDKENQFSLDYDIYFLGYKINPFQYLSKSYLFLFPSGWEGFPLALCEAMIAGVPVLCSDCPTGPREILAPGTFNNKYQLREAEITNSGILLPTLDKREFKEQWVNTCLKLLRDQDLRNKLIEGAQQRMQSFDKAVVTSKWQHLIEELIITPESVNK